MKNKWLRSLLAAWLASLLVAPARAWLSAEGMPVGNSISAGRPSIPDTGLSQEEKIVHLLNRTGFGPRPGDVARVREMGIAAYLEQQLQPETVPDEALEQRLAEFQTLRMTQVELLATYPPLQMLRQIGRQLSRMGVPAETVEQMFPELKAYRERRRRREAGGPESQSPPEQTEPDPQMMQQRDQRRMLRQALNHRQRIGLELSQAKLLRAVHSERQLQEVMVDFWFNHFNVFAGKGADGWLVTSYEYQAIRPHALGKFRDLLGATARHPAMLFYLDNWMSADPEAAFDNRTLQMRYLEAANRQGIPPGGVTAELLRQRGFDTAQLEQRLHRQQRFLQRIGEGRRGVARQGQRPRRLSGLNENYARELMELHTLGVDGGYTQQDIVEVARCFTGWTLLPLQLGQQFVFVPEMHDVGSKTVLGKKISGDGIEDGEAVLDLLARHPATARFISTKLARRLVSDNPPDSLIGKMASTFQKTDGDIRAVLRTLFTSEEFWSPAAVRAKVKTPLEFVVSAARATGAELGEPAAGERTGQPRRAGHRRGRPGLVGALRRLGMPLYGAQPPTGYKDTADAWVSTGDLLGRMQVAIAFAANRLPGVRVPLPPELRQAKSQDELVRTVAEWVLAQSVSEATHNALSQELTKVAGQRGGEAGGLNQMQARLALGWLLASPEFQRR